MEISDVITLSRAYEQQKFVMETVFEISDLLQSESVFDESKTEVNCKMLLVYSTSYVSSPSTISNLVFSNPTASKISQ